jgi:hypothetical protein
MRSESENPPGHVQSSNGNIDIEARSPQEVELPSGLNTQGVILDYPGQPIVVTNKPTPTKNSEHVYPKFDDMRFHRIAFILSR